jgi:phospholipase/carboxylesterase
VNLCEPLLAAHVIAFSGRFATTPRVAPQAVFIHLIHGEADAVIAVNNSLNAARQLRALGGNVRLDTEPGMGHGINARMLSMALDKNPGR